MGSNASVRRRRTVREATFAGARGPTHPKGHFHCPAVRTRAEGQDKWVGWSAGVGRRASCCRYRLAGARIRAPDTAIDRPEAAPAKLETTTAPPLAPVGTVTFTEVGAV